MSTNPNINFVVYIPTRDQSPLIIYDESGQLVFNNKHVNNMFVINMFVCKLMNIHNCSFTRCF